MSAHPAGMTAGKSKLVVDGASLSFAANALQLGRIDYKILLRIIEREIAGGPGSIGHATMVCRKSEIAGKVTSMTTAGFNVRVADTATHPRMDDIQVEDEIDNTYPEQFDHLILLGIDKDFLIALDECQRRGIRVTLVTLHREDPEHPRISRRMKERFEVVSLYRYAEHLRHQTDEVKNRKPVRELEPPVELPVPRNFQGGRKAFAELIKSALENIGLDDAQAY